MAKYTKDQLKALGMDDAQIAAIMSVYKTEENGSENVSGQNSQVVAPTHTVPVVPVIEDLKITSVSDLHIYGQGKVVRFPDFAEGQPFVARVRRPSMLVLAKQGKIPNALLNSANELFANGGSGMDADNPKMLSDIYDVCEVIAEAALMQPTYAEIKQAGIQLSDNQMMALFSYTQNGIRALESFR